EFDLLKGIGILLVILGHIHIPSDLFCSLIYGVHMPLFFFVSGWFFRKRPIGEHLLHSLRQLLIPWAFFSMVLLVTHWIINSVGMGNPVEALKNTFSKIDFLNEKCWVLYRVIWFFIGMFWVRLFYMISSYFLNGRLSGLISALLFGLGMILQYCHIEVPLFIDSACTTVIFYHLGSYLSRKQWFSSINWQKGLVAAIAYVVIIFVWTPYTDLFQNIYAVYMLPVTFAGITALYCACRWMSHQQGIAADILEYIGRNSIIIFGLHGAILELLDIVLTKVACPTVASFFIRFIVLVSLSLLIGSAIKRYCPVLIGQKNGKQQ
ncbi:MAG: acyltransferase family protein, partial [Muribaculaceae bacterium]|nr:acyltransferase family protein [Muribaculaceae bacterium]